MAKLNIVSMVEINGKRYRQEDIPPEEFQKILKEVMTRAARSIGCRLIETA